MCVLIMKRLEVREIHFLGCQNAKDVNHLTGRYKKAGKYLLRIFVMSQ